MPRSRWIIDARWDGAFCFATLWFPPALYGLWKSAEAAGLPPSETALAIATVGTAIPHFLTTFTFTYMDPEQRAAYRDRWVLYYAIPLLLILGCWAHSALIGPRLLITLWLAFGEHHVAAQNIGFLALYRKRNGEGDVDRRIDHLVFNTAWVTTVAVFLTRPLGEPALEYYSRPTYAYASDDRFLLVAILGALSAIAMLVFLGRQLQRWWTGRPVSRPKLLFMVTTWPTFLLVPFLVDQLELVLILRSSYHNIQYLGLVHLLNVRRCRARGPARMSGALGRLVSMGPLGYAGVRLLATVAVWYVTDYAPLHVGWANDFSLIYIFYPGIPLAHFFLDGLTWRFSEEHGRRTVLRFLGPAPPVTTRQANVAA